MNKRTRVIVSLIIAIISFLVVWQTSNKLLANQHPNESEKTKKEKKEEFILATTTSTQDSGLLDTIIPAFEASYDHQVKVKVIAVGTGQALKLGRDGNADVLLVHARPLEDQFMEQGYGEVAYDIMYNQFLLVGPPDDPADVKESSTVAEAFSRIAQSNSTFISRGDESGTHQKEKAIWSKSNNPDPKGKWYISVGQGMGVTMQMAGELYGYTLVDEATYLTNTQGLESLFTEDAALFNPYGMIIVKNTPKEKWAQRLIQFFISKEGQQIIAQFGQDQFGKALFVPNTEKR